MQAQLLGETASETLIPRRATCIVLASVAPAIDALRRLPPNPIHLSRGSLNAVLTPLVIGVAFFATIGVVVWVLRRAAIGTAQRAAAVPVPERWLRLLDRNVPASSGLTTAERVRLLQRSRDLIGRAHWEGCRGPEFYAQLSAFYRQDPAATSPTS